jgi:hypothetical protein
MSRVSKLFSQNFCVVATASILASTLISEASAYRVIAQLETAYELRLSGVELPTEETGYVRFQACTTCTRLSLPVSGETLFSINGSAATITEFAEYAQTLLGASNRGLSAGVTVFLNTESQQVTRLILTVL